MRGLAALLVLSLPPAHASAAPCPAWPERQTIDCMRGYVRVDPVAMTIALDQNDFAYQQRPANRLGYALGVSGGMFRAFSRFALAAGARLGAAIQPFSDPALSFDRLESHLHVGPELRLGAAGERWFVYGLARGGYTRRGDGGGLRTSVAAPSPHGGHWGLGVGAWGRLGRRVLYGGEVTLDTVHVRFDDVYPTLTLSLSLGAWL